jgi:NAD(P)-dependent dehydrogenase (short-subunit alcohol dehydrogenase family)
MLLESKIACVTGAARGIGLAVARRYADEGARVVLGDVDLARGEAAAAAIRQAGGAATFIAVDVTDEASLEGFLAGALAWAGRVDVVVANAGVIHYAPLIETTRADWDRVLAINLTGVALTCQVFARQLVRQGTGGRIICASSNAGKRGAANVTAYCATKFGVIGLVQSLALELAPHGITVNAVCPGEVDTEMYEYLLEQWGREAGVSPAAYRSQVEGAIPLGRRLADPREIADAYLFLASPLADYVTGSTVDVTGGMF